MGLWRYPLCSCSACPCVSTSAHPAQVGALRELRKDMGVRRNVLLKAVVDEVEERVYHSSIGADAADKGEAEDEIPELQVCLGLGSGSGSGSASGLGSSVEGEASQPEPRQSFQLVCFMALTLARSVDTPRNSCCCPHHSKATGLIGPMLFAGIQAN